MKLMQALTVATMTLISSVAFSADLDVSCYKGLTVNANSVALVQYTVANTQSARMLSGLAEKRSATDNEEIPSFLVSQYKFQPLEILVETDDGAGTLDAQLQAIYIGKKAGEKARYLGAYKRSAAGRQLSSVVTCVVKEQ